MFARPPWQTGPNIPAGAMRCVPDVAAYAFDPYFRLFCYYDGRDAGANGTSSASPIWAGLCALINQARAQAGLGPVGLLGPKIYPLNGTSAFNQITTGLMLDANSTFVLSEGATNGAYSVGPNYNMVTGLGSPNIGNLIAALTLPPAGAGSAPAITTQPQSQTCAQGATATFSATATGAPVPAYQWYFTIPGSVLDTLCADGLQSDGSTFSGSSTSSLTITNVRWHEILTVLARNANGAIASIPASLNISTFVPTLAWGSPAPIAVGTPLSSIQLNATSSVSGTFTYSPPVGTLLPVGVQTLSVAFTPTNTTTYSGATLTQTLTVQFPAALASDVLPSRFTAGWNAVAGAADYHLNVCTNSALTRFVPGYQNLEVGSATAVDVTGLTPGVTYYYQVFAYDSSGMTIGTSTIIPVTTSNAISISTPLIVSTLAGRVLLPGNADGTGPNAEFNDPLGVGLTASDGNLYVVDSGNNAIRQIQISTGTVSSFLGQSAHLKNPTGITSDSSGNVYVADTLNHVVRKVTASGVVSTLAGNVGAAGSSDGIGTGAAFNAPQGIAADAAGNLYVADTNNQTIRRIVAATGSVSTIAGNVGTIGHTDGTGTGALFNYPSGVAVDSSGNIFVADTENSTIRSLTNGGVVTTVAGIATSSGCADGIGTAAQFNSPSAIALDTSSGNLYVADTENFTIRMVVPSSRVVTTLAGTVGTSGSADGSGSAALFYRPSGITTDGAGNIYIADTNNQTIRLGILKLPPTIETQPQSQTATAGSNASFSVTATGRPTPTCQWNFNGSAIGGATGSSYSIASAQLSNAGIYTVTLTNAMGSVTSTAATLTVNAGPPPPGGSSSSGGGGGAASPWFLVALAIVAVARFRTYNLLWRARAVVPIGADH
jgi:sugar lactone lactonase YvrE